MILFNKGKEEDQEHDQHHAVGNGYFDINVDYIEFFTSSTFHEPAVFLTTYAASSDIIPNPMLSGINHFDLGFLDPKGIMTAAPNQPAERFVSKSERIIRNAESIDSRLDSYSIFCQAGGVK